MKKIIFMVNGNKISSVRDFLEYLTKTVIYHPRSHLLQIALIFLLFMSSTLFAQQNTITEQIQRAYHANSLRFNDTLFEINSSDSNSTRAAKNYYRALLHHDVQDALLLHSTNFSSFSTEHYGKMSGIQLVSIDFINHEHDKALAKLDQIGDSLPDALYWRAKITQLNQKYDDAISLSQNFIRQFQNNPSIPYIWLILLESYFQKEDSAGFERNYRTFSSYASFDEYKPYLLYLNGQMIENSDVARARSLYSQVINEFPHSQFRVQSEDRLFALRASGERPTTPITTPVPPRANPTSTPTSPSTVFRNIVASRYEDLVRDSFYIQFGVFSTENAARNLVSTLNNESIQVFHITKPVGGRRLFAVVQGPYATLSDAQASLRIYNSRNHQCFVFKAE